MDWLEAIFFRLTTLKQEAANRTFSETTASSGSVVLHPKKKTTVEQYGCFQK